MVLLTWLFTRGLVLWLYLGRHSWVTGDVDYFAQSLRAAGEVGLDQTLVEYPLPGVVVIALPWLLAEALGAPGAYAGLVLVVSLMADAAFTALLWRCGDRRPAAVTTWLLAVPLLGATTYARFDLVPALLAAVGLLLMTTRPGLGAASASLATGFKLWPALVLPALAAPRASRRLVVSVVAVAGAVLAGTTVVLAGWGRLLSPLTWQADRGLQIESVPATPAMLGWAVSPASFEIFFGDHNAYEIVGAGTDTLLLASRAATLIAAAGLVLLWARALRNGAQTPEAVSWPALAGVTLFLVTSKVLSPQYMLWLLPLAAAALAVTPRRGQAGLRRWTAVLLVATAATQGIFPELYGGLTGVADHTGWAVTTLALRNVLLVWLAVWATARAVRAVSGAGRSTASPPVRRGRSRAASGGGPTTPS